MDAKQLEIAIKDRRSTMTKDATVILNMQGNKISSTFYISNLRDWDAILGQLFLAVLHMIMDVRNNKISIQSMWKL